MSSAKPLPRSRFDMFVTLSPGVISWFPGQKKQWCYPGNQFTDLPPKMLRNLLGLLQRKIHLFDVVELYDNEIAKDDPKRIILKIGGGVMQENRLTDYIEFIKNIPLSPFLKP